MQENTRAFCGESMFQRLNFVCPSLSCCGEARRRKERGKKSQKFAENSPGRPEKILLDQSSRVFKRKTLGETTAAPRVEKPKQGYCCSILSHSPSLSSLTLTFSLSSFFLSLSPKNSCEEACLSVCQRDTDSEIGPFYINKSSQNVQKRYNLDH